MELYYSEANKQFNVMIYMISMYMESFDNLFFTKYNKLHALVIVCCWG